MRCLITLTKNSNIIITYIAYDFFKKGQFLLFLAQVYLERTGQLHIHYYSNHTLQNTPVMYC